MLGDKMQAQVKLLLARWDEHIRTGQSTTKQFAVFLDGLCSNYPKDLVEIRDLINSYPTLSSLSYNLSVKGTVKPRRSGGCCGG
jgi:hypothetical protein